MAVLSKNELKSKIPDIDRLIKLLTEVRVFKERLISTGELAQFYCEKLFDISQQNLKWNSEGCDGFLPDGSPVEVKQRKGKLTFPLDISKIKYLFLVDLKEDFLPKEIYKIPVEKDSTKWTEQSKDKDKKRIDIPYYTNSREYLVYEDVS